MSYVKHVKFVQMSSYVNTHVDYEFMARALILVTTLQVRPKQVSKTTTNYYHFTLKL